MALFGLVVVKLPIQKSDYLFLEYAVERERAHTMAGNGVSGLFPIIVAIPSRYITGFLKKRGRPK